MEENSVLEARATLKHARISARKVKIVADLLRGKDVSEALAIVKFTPKASSEIIEKLLKSAIANAENNHKLNIDKLVVTEAYTGNRIVMKRMHARGRGRGARVLKPFSKLTIVVAERGE